MNYIYDIYLNFNEYLYDFFDWDKNDKLVHIKTIPIFKVSEEKIKTIINYNIKIIENDFNNIYNKSTIWNKSNKYKNYALFCDENNIIAVEFNNNGISINKSYLNINDELEVLENIYNIKTKNINFKPLNKNKNILKTRKQIKEENFINNELKNTNTEKLKYIYFECFGKKECDYNKIRRRILNLSKNSKEYKVLYNILKLTSTTAK